MKKIAICVPCFGRPQRTKRAVESILAQTFNGWQAYIIGDGCPDFEKVMEENLKMGSESWLERAARNGNEIIMFNAYKHEGGYGYSIRNYVMDCAEAEFLMFLDNDDTLEPNHFETYLNGIEGTDYDFAYYNTKMQYMKDYHVKCNNGMLPGPYSYIRRSHLTEGNIGHAEIIIRIKFLKGHPKIRQTPEYGHDWKFIKQMIDAGASYAKAELLPATYNIMGAGELRETDID